MLVTVLLTSACAVIGTLGIIHLVYTFRSDKFEPRDKDLGQELRQVSPILTKETSMWKAWVGFNASHSLGRIAVFIDFRLPGVCSNLSSCWHRRSWWSR